MKSHIYQPAACLIGALALLAGCSQNDGAKDFQSSQIKPQAFLGTPPENRETELAQLSRYIGQTEFLNPASQYFPDQRAEAGQAEGSDEAREEQESDVYKIGKEGSKLLFLLNNYRGLQVISYANGPEQPEVIGRVPATGKFSDDMYYDASRDRIVVLERDWQSDSEDKSRLVVYDVSNPNEPKIDQTQSVKGSYVDSRIVGDVLYVASRTNEKGVVLSYDLTKSYLPVVDQRELAQQVSYRENMNIIETQNGDQFQYYLVSILADSNWSWWDRQSSIEVIDISSPKGHIKPLMLASAKGRVDERSQTTIKDGTLIVTSNYSAGEGEDRIMRVAVETFILPTEDAAVISENEAQYRKLAIERELKGLTGEAYEKKQEELLKDAELGLIGRFVESAGTLKKLFADSSVTVGDTTGLHANLQDVRYSDDLLYAFWVPQNMIDPFDLFDISAPQEGVKYLGRLQFDGWIERAIPMTVEGRQFVLGLGWIVPNVNNENGRRAPQAKIFEIMEIRGQTRAMDVANLDLEDSKIYTNFNTADKNIEVSFTDEGVGRVLFQATRYSDDSYQSGGQIINFDLKAVLANQVEQGLTEGAFLTGSSSWIRRVFTNPSIDRINSFSDRALATYEQGDVSVKSTIDPAHVLELARNIRAYETLKAAAGPVGVQLISDYNWWSKDESFTLLRSVPSDKADTEKPAVLSELKIDGSYIGHLVVGGGSELLVLTNTFESIKTENDGYTYKTTNYVHRVQMDAGQKLTLMGEVSWVHSREDDVIPMGFSEVAGPDYGYGYGNRSSALIALPDGRILAQANSSLKWIEMGAGVQAITPQFESCVLKDRSQVQVRVLNGQSYLTSSDVFKSATYPGLMLRRNFASPLSGSGNSLVCLGERNIPGELIANKGDYLLTDDTWATDVVRKEVKYQNEEKSYVYYELLKENSLTLTEVNDEGQAVLVDERSDAGQGHRASLGKGRFVQILQEGQYGTANLAIVSISDQGRILEDNYHLDHDLKGQPRLQKLVELVGGGEFLAVIGSGDEIQVIRFSEESPRPTVEKLVLLDSDFQPLKTTTKLELPGSYFYYSQGDAIHYTESQKSFEIAKGLSGIVQFLLADQSDAPTLE